MYLRIALAFFTWLYYRGTTDSSLAAAEQSLACHLAPSRIVFSALKGVYSFQCHIPILYTEGVPWICGISTFLSPHTSFSAKIINGNIKQCDWPLRKTLENASGSGASFSAIHCWTPSILKRYNLYFYSYVLTS